VAAGNLPQRRLEPGEGGFDLTVLARKPLHERAHLLALGATRGAGEHCGEQVLLLVGVVRADRVAEELQRRSGDVPRLRCRLEERRQSAKILQVREDSDVALRELRQRRGVRARLRRLRGVLHRRFLGCPDAGYAAYGAHR
jgi:hypothetical protein